MSGEKTEMKHLLITTPFRCVHDLLKGRVTSPSLFLNNKTNKRKDNETSKTQKIVRREVFTEREQLETR